MKDKSIKMSKFENSVYMKSQLVQMNQSEMGHKWIRNIEQIGENEPAKLYMTGDACWMSGRIFIALPESLKITPEVEVKYNLWL